MSNSSSMISEEAAYQPELNVKLTNKGMLIYHGWSTEQILSLLRDKLLRQHKLEFLPVCNNAHCDTSPESWQAIIHSGIYNEHILTRLEERGMSARDIMKAMKYGLLRLDHEELKCFQDIGTKDMYVIKDTDTWIRKPDEKLIWNLLVTGLTKDQCWNIVMCGLMAQDKSILCRLLSSGIDVPGILSWTDQIKPVTSTMIEFLKKLGIDEDTIHYVKENGIDDEAEDMLDNLGYNEYEKEEVLAEILHEGHFICSESSKSLTVASSSEAADFCSSSDTISTPANTQCDTPFACTCNLYSLPEKQDHKTLSGKDYLRQNVLVPLTWAINKAVEYKPSNPQYYIAYQLLRWKYKNVSQEVDDIQQFVTSSAAVMDRKFLKKCKKKEEEDVLRRLNEITVKDTCDVCLERQKLHRMKKHCNKCKRVPFGKK